MKPFRSLRGPAAPLFENDVDTDQICPKQHLKALTRIDFSGALFSDRRGAGESFILDRSGYEDAVILIAGENFGCGSSREHAVWALADFGIRCIIAPSFGEIFARNCVNSGVLTISTPLDTARALAAIAVDHPRRDWTIDLEAQRITSPTGAAITFDIEPARKSRLLEGKDDIARTLRHQEALASFEARLKTREPWLFL